MAALGLLWLLLNPEKTWAPMMMQYPISFLILVDVRMLGHSNELLLDSELHLKGG